MVWRLYEHGICFVDLAPLADPRLIPSALAAALGVAVAADDPTEGVIAFLSDQRMLVVCDSCEHVGAAAVLVEKVLKGVPGVDVLATSREPLRAEGRCLPPAAAGNSADVDRPHCRRSTHVSSSPAIPRTRGIELGDGDSAGGPIGMVGPSQDYYHGQTPDTS